MKLCYVVFREDNTMVFHSQVLEYLQVLKNNPDIEQTELIVFRKSKKEPLEQRIHKYVDHCKTFASGRIFLNFQLCFYAKKLRQYIKKTYNKNDNIAVICRGGNSSYIASKALKRIPNSRILFDNRGLPIEESQMRNDNIIRKFVRVMKKQVINYAKSHCDMYNFVTSPMRDYLVEKYNYKSDIPFTIIPTLYNTEDNISSTPDNNVCKCDFKFDFTVSYIGSMAVWQSSNKLIELIVAIGNKYPKARFFILTKDNLSFSDAIPKDIKDRIIFKNVPHSEIKHYLANSDLGIVLRDDNIVNRVAAPTKIAEYLTSGIPILYSGDIGILTDLKNAGINTPMIDIAHQNDWLENIEKYVQLRRNNVDTKVVEYFDMKTRQRETLEMIKNSFKNRKVK